MVERQNYLKTRKHLIYLDEVQQLMPASLERYRFYLRHLLIWAGENDFKDVHNICPTFPIYLSTLPGNDGKVTLAGTTQKKILDNSKRFLRWAKATFPCELNCLPAVWIDTLCLTRQPQVTTENVFVSNEDIPVYSCWPATPRSINSYDN
jgi:hypothetical protein